MAFLCFWPVVGYFQPNQEGRVKNCGFGVLKWALIGLFSFFILIGCGGGGGGSDSSELMSSSGDIFTFSEDSLRVREPPVDNRPPLCLRCQTQQLEFGVLV
jgi:hypothetical protein